MVKNLTVALNITSKNIIATFFIKKYKYVPICIDIGQTVFVFLPFLFYTVIRIGYMYMMELIIVEDVHDFLYYVGSALWPQFRLMSNGGCARPN